ncbi:unnamed protein product [Haemonchus placei]|uniref:IgA FC receptor n=1 Tax=Haemonchus placei TaxID=6290 RepID=A0A0N4WK49_HAEPC|nr:unnamed protein product [Haemonchus placei]
MLYTSGLLLLLLKPLLWPSEAYPLYDPEPEPEPIMGPPEPPIGILEPVPGPPPPPIGPPVPQPIDPVEWTENGEMVEAETIGALLETPKMIHKAILPLFVITFLRLSCEARPFPFMGPPPPPFMGPPPPPPPPMMMRPMMRPMMPPPPPPPPPMMFRRRDPIRGMIAGAAIGGLLGAMG